MKKAALTALFCASLAFAGGADLKNFFSHFTELFSTTNHKAMLDAEMVHFPLTLKGTLDDSPGAKISSKQFAFVLNKVANQPSGMNARDFNETEKDFLSAQSAKGKLPEESGNGTVRMGNLVFAQKKGQWKLVLVYVADDLLAEIKKNRR